MADNPKNRRLPMPGQGAIQQQAAQLAAPPGSWTSQMAQAATQDDQAQGQQLSTAKVPKYPEPDTPGVGEALGDIGNQVMRGGAQTAGGAAWALDQLGAEDTAASLRNLSEEAQQYWGEGLSDKARHDLKRLHEGDLSAYGALLAASGSVLPTAAGMGAGGAAAKGLQAAGMGTRAAGMTGYSAGEAGVQAPVAAEDTYQDVVNRDHEELFNRSEQYRQAYQENVRNGLDEETARESAKELVGDAASRRAAAYSGATTAALSAPFGGFLGRAASGLPGRGGRLRNMAEGAATEGAQEFVQEGSQQISQNIAIQQTADQTQGPTEGALNSAIAGAAAGGVMGAGFGALTPPPQGGQEGQQESEKSVQQPKQQDQQTQSGQAEGQPDLQEPQVPSFGAYQEGMRQQQGGNYANRATGPMTGALQSGLPAPPADNQEQRGERGPRLQGTGLQKGGEFIPADEQRQEPAGSIEQEPIEGRAWPATPGFSDLRPGGRTDQQAKAMAERFGRGEDQGQPTLPEPPQGRQKEEGGGPERTINLGKHGKRQIQLPNHVSDQVFEVSDEVRKGKNKSKASQEQIDKAFKALRDVGVDTDNITQGELGNYASAVRKEAQQFGADEKVKVGVPATDYFETVANRRRREKAEREASTQRSVEEEAEANVTGGKDPADLSGEDLNEAARKSADVQAVERIDELNEDQKRALVRQRLRSEVEDVTRNQGVHGDETRKNPAKAGHRRKVEELLKEGGQAPYKAVRDYPALREQYPRQIIGSDPGRPDWMTETEEDRQRIQEAEAVFQSPRQEGGEVPQTLSEVEPTEDQIQEAYDRKVQKGAFDTADYAETPTELRRDADMALQRTEDAKGKGISDEKYAGFSDRMKQQFAETRRKQRAKGYAAERLADERPDPKFEVGSRVQTPGGSAGEVTKTKYKPDGESNYDLTIKPDSGEETTLPEASLVAEGGEQGGQEAGQEWETHTDHGPPNWTPGDTDITRQDRGPVDPKKLARLPGAEGEEELFKQSPTGRMSQEDWGSLVADIKERGVQDPPLVVKEADGGVRVNEGNHRIQAAVEAGVDQIPVEVRYFGGSDQQGLVIDPETGETGEGYNEDYQREPEAEEPEPEDVETARANVRERIAQDPEVQEIAAQYDKDDFHLDERVDDKAEEVARQYAQETNIRAGLRSPENLIRPDGREDYDQIHDRARELAGETGGEGGGRQRRGIQPGNDFQGGIGSGQEQTGEEGGTRESIGQDGVEEGGANVQPTPDEKLTESEAIDRLEWVDMGTEGGVKQLKARFWPEDGGGFESVATLEKEAKSGWRIDAPKYAEPTREQNLAKMKAYAVQNEIIPRLKDEGYVLQEGEQRTEENDGAERGGPDQGVEQVEEGGDEGGGRSGEAGPEGGEGGAPGEAPTYSGHNLSEQASQQLDLILSELPPSVQNFMELQAQRGKPIVFRQRTEEEMGQLPADMRERLRLAKAVTWNKMRIELMDDRFDREVIQHELTHMAYDRMSKAAKDDAQERAANDGERIVKTARAKKNIPEELQTPNGEMARKNVAKQARRLKKRDRDSLWQSIELDMALGNAWASDIAEAIGLEVTEEQYVSLALGEWAARENSINLNMGEMREEEMAYRAGLNDQYADSLFTSVNEDLRRRYGVQGQEQQGEEPGEDQGGEVEGSPEAQGPAHVLDRIEELEPQYLERLQKGDDLSAPEVAPMAGEVGRGEDNAREQAPEDYAQINAYRRAVKRFLEGDLEQKPPRSKDRKIPVGVTQVEDTAPFAPQPRKAGGVQKVKDFEGTVREVGRVSAKDDARRYLEGVYINPEKNHLVASDGNRMTILEQAGVQNESKRIRSPKQDTEINGRYPDYERVMPEPMGGEDGVTVNAQDILPNLNGIKHATRFMRSIKDNYSVTVQAGGEQAGVNNAFLSDAVNIMRRFGHEQFRAQVVGDGNMLYLESPDGRVRHVIMAMSRADPPVFDLGEIGVSGQAAGSQENQGVVDQEGGGGETQTGSDGTGETQTGETRGGPEDFGERLEGAKKHEADKYKRQIEEYTELDAIEAAPLSKVFPKPNYQKLYNEGMSPDKLEALALLRNTIDAKPKGQSRLDDKYRRRWAAHVYNVKTLADDILYGDLDTADLEAEVERGWAGLERPVVIQQAVQARPIVGEAVEEIAQSDGSVPDAIQALEDVRLEKRKDGRIRVGDETVELSESQPGWILRGAFQNKKNPGFHIHRALDYDAIAHEGRDKLVELVNQRSAEAQKPKYTPVEVRYYKNTNEGLITWKPRGKIEILMRGFDGPKAAREYLENHRDEIQAEIDRIRQGPQMRGSENQKRQGPARREGHATEADYNEAFGFRGVQFGRSVSGNRRQQDMDEAYDALVDMADVIDVPTQALSLSGRLGLAFGARGRGGKRPAKAHFEPDQVVINLTQTAGPGSLGHEWFHALDNYFARKMGDTTGMATKGATHQQAEGAVRPEVLEAWRNLSQTLKSSGFEERAKQLDQASSKPYWSQPHEMAARAYEKYLVDRLAGQEVTNDYLANIEAESGAFPTDEEMAAGITQAFDNLFQTLETQTTEDGTILYSMDPGSTTEEVFAQTPDQVAQELRKAWGKKAVDDLIANETINIVPTQRDLPGHIQQVGGTIRGAHDRATGSSYLVAANIEPGMASGALAHEVGAHYGLRQMLGDKRFGEVLEQVDRMVANGNKAAIRARDRVPEDAPTRHLTEETLANLIEDRANHGLGVIQKVKAGIRGFLNRLGVVKKLTPDDITVMAQSAIRRLSRGHTIQRGPGVGAQAGDQVRFSREDRDGSEETGTGSESTGQDTGVDESDIDPAIRPDASESEQNKHNFLKDFGRVATRAPEAGEVTQYIKDKWGTLRSGFLRLLTLDQVEDVGKGQFVSQGGGRINPLSSFRRDTNRFQEERNEMVAEASNLRERWNRFMRQDREASDTLADMMNRATIAEIHPDQPLDEQEHVQEMEQELEDKRQQIETTERELAEGNIPEWQRPSLENGLKEMRERVEELEHNLAEGPRLRELWDQLPEEAREIYTEVRESYEKYYNEVMEALEDRAKETASDEANAQQVVSQIHQQFQQAKQNGPYFPLHRFGDYWIKVDRGEGRKPIFEMVENTRQQTRRMRELRQEGYTDDQIAHGKMGEHFPEMEGVSDNFLTQLVSQIEANAKDTQEKDALKDAAYQLYLKHLPEMSYKKQFIHRKKTPGYSGDVARGYAQQMFHGAYQLARLRFTHKLKQHIDDMQNQVDNQEVADPVAAQEVVDRVKSHFQYLQDPGGAAWVQKATSLGFTWYLGATPAAALINVTQTPLMALPNIGAKMGFNRTAAQLLKSNRDYYRIIKSADEHTGEITLDQDLKDEVSYGEDMEAAINKFSREGGFDLTLAGDLAGQGQSPSEVYNDRWQRAMKYVSFMFHEAERYNRIVTFSAAYRLARDKGWSDVDAYEFAHDMTYNSHFDYSNVNRATILQNNLSRIPFMFMQFAQNMIYQVGRNLQQSMAGEDKETRRLAQKRFAGIMGMHALLAGAYGLPGATLFAHAMDTLTSLFSDGEDDEFDAKTEFRNFLAEYLGPTTTTAITKGLPRALTPMDLHGRVSLDGLLFREPSQDLQGEEHARYYLEQFAGPMYSMLKNFAGGMHTMATDGQVMRGLEDMTPKAIADLLTAVRWSDKGVRNFRQDVIVDDVTPAEIITQAMGFTPSRVSQHYDAYFAVDNAQKRIQRQRSIALNRYWLGMRNDDPDLRREAMQQIQSFNRQYPEMAITPNTLWQSMESRYQHTAESKMGIHVKESLRPRLLGDLKAFDLSGN